MNVRRWATTRRGVLWAGFGALLAIILLIAWSSTQTVSDIEEENTRLRTAFLKRDDLLDRVRVALAENASDVRDYLIEPNPEAAAARLLHIDSQRQNINGALDSYARSATPEEAPHLQQLRSGIQSYWDALDPALHWTPQTRRKLADSFLREQIMPRHDQLVAILDAVAQVDDRNVAATEQKIARLFHGFHRAVFWSVALALAVGFLVAFLSIQRILELERNSDRQLSELKQLSDRVVSAQEEERRRLSRELHDEVAQGISAVLVQIKRLDNRLAATDTDAREVLKTAREMGDHALTQIRDMALLLRPSMLDDLGLVPALKWQAREIARRTGLKVKVSADSVSEDLPEEHRTCIYRIVQEALNNVALHARASSARIDAQQEADSIRVTVQDDGHGFDPTQEKGMGILGMEERVKTLGGTFRIDSAAEQGTKISITLPILQSAAAGRSL